MKRIIWYTIVVLLTLAGLILLWQFREAAVLFLLSLGVAAAFRPAIESLVKRGVPRSAAILLCYVIGIGVLVFLIILASGPLLTELQQVTDRFTLAYTRFKDTNGYGTDFGKSIAERLPPMDALYKAITGNQGMALAQTVLGFATSFIDIVSRLVIVVVLSIYWSIDIVHFERLWLSVLPAEQRSRGRQIWRGIEKGVGAYIRSEIIQSVLAGILLWLAYRTIGLDYPTLLAIYGALVWLIPWLGAVLALVPPFLIGFMVSPILGIMAALATLAILIVLEAVVEPRIFHRERYSSLLIVILVIALSDVYGLIGLLIAPPLAAAIQIFFRHFQAQPINEVKVDPVEQITNLRMQLDRVREMAEKLDEKSPQVENLMERLNHLINESEEAIKAETNS